MVSSSLIALIAQFGGMECFMLVVYAVVGICQIILLVAAWKMMRAHESLADAVRDLATHLSRPQH